MDLKRQARSEDYQRHLDRVSRSFAFCIAQLEGDFRFYVGHCYLLFRVLDTIEDAIWRDPRHQSQSFREFNTLLQNSEDVNLLNSWKSHLLRLDLPEAERVLIEDVDGLFHDFHHLLPGEVRSTVLRCALNMSHGMEYFSRRSQGGKMRLSNLLDVNRYCFFVAGVVGELLHQVFIRVYPGNGQDEDQKKSVSDALHFGLFLQKVNILKDQISDEKQGRYLVPSRDEVQRSLLQNSQRGLDYLLKLPKEVVSYRIFCGWSLFLGVASLPWIEKSWQDKSGVKIPRIKTKLLLDRVAERAQNNEQLKQLFDELLSRLPWAPPMETVSSEKQDFPEFNGLYSGDLSRSQMVSLGLIT